MEFKRVCRALYKYDAVEEGELSFEEDAVVYIWDDSNDEWWRASLEMAQNESELVTGLIPYNYVEEMEHLCKARAIYTYEALNNDELSFEEGAEFLVYQKDGEDWMMVNYNGSFGFVPQSYVEEFSEVSNEDQGYIEPPSKIAEQEHHEPEPVKDSHQESVPSAPFPLEVRPMKKSLKDDMLYWRVSEVDKKRKTKKKIRLGISSDIFYVASEDNKHAPIRQWPISDLATYGIKNKHVLIEIAGDNPISFDLSCSSIKQAEAIAFKIRSCSKASFNDKTVVKSSGLFGMFKKKEAKPKAPPASKGRTMETRNSNHMSTLREKNNSSPLPAIPPSHYTPETVVASSRDSNYTKKSDSFNGQAHSHEHPDSLSRHNIPTEAPPAKSVSNPAPAKTSGGEEGEIAVVLYDFDGVEEDELSVQADERIYVIDGTNADWWVCRVYYDDGQFKDGLVPSDYVSLLSSEKPAPKSNPIPASSEPVSVPSPVPSEPTPKPVTKDTSGPNPDRLREWTDATGSFKVEAELVKYADGKIHLHKTNGVKIAVPLEKMSAIDVHYVSEVIGQDLSENFEAAKRERAEISKWKEFLVDAGISVADASTYATKFTQEKIDRQLLKEMDRLTLKGLGLTEGDALRVEKAIQKAKDEEDEALAKRLQQEEIDRMHKGKGAGKNQIEQDAMLARKLQDEADSSTWRNFPPKSSDTQTKKYGLGLGNKTGRPTKNVNFDALFEASAKLQEENLKESPKPIPKTTSTKSGFDDDIWAVPGAKPAPKPIPSLQVKPEDDPWGSLAPVPKVKEQAEKPVFSRKDSSRPTKSSEIEEKWGFVQANFENPPPAKPASQPTPQPTPAVQPAPNFKPSGPLAQPLIPIPRGGSSNVFVPTRRPPPKPVSNVFADAPAAAPSIGAGVTTRVAPKMAAQGFAPQPNIFAAPANGITTRAAPTMDQQNFSSQSNLFGDGPVPKMNNQPLTSQTNMFSDISAPKMNSQTFASQANLFSDAPAPKMNTQSFTPQPNLFAEAPKNFPSQSTSISSEAPFGSNSFKSSYQFEDLSLESLGLKPKPSLPNLDARPHSSMGLRSPANPKDSFYAQPEPSAFKSSSSLSFGDATHRPGPVGANRATHNPAGTGLNQPVGSYTSNFQNPTSNFSAAPVQSAYQTGYISDVKPTAFLSQNSNSQFSNLSQATNSNMQFSSSYQPTNPSMQSSNSYQPPISSMQFSGTSYQSTKPSMQFSNSALPVSSEMQFSGSSQASNSNMQFSSTSFQPTNPNLQFSGSSQATNSSMQFSGTGYQPTKPNMEFSSYNQPSNSSMQFTTSNQLTNPNMQFSGTSYQSTNSNMQFSSSSYQPASSNMGSSSNYGAKAPMGNFESTSFSGGSAQSYQGMNSSGGYSGTGYTQDFNKGFSHGAPNPGFSATGGYGSNNYPAGGLAQDFSYNPANPSSLSQPPSMSNFSYPGAPQHPAPSNSYSAFSGVDPLKSGFNSNQQPPRFYPN